MYVSNDDSDLTAASVGLNIFYFGIKCTILPNKFIVHTIKIFFTLKVNIDVSIYDDL